MLRFTPAIALLAGIVSITGVASRLMSDDRPAKISVSVEDLGKRVILIGRCGKPLAEMMTVRGSWALPENKLVKDYSLIFTITHVDDQLLVKPVQFNGARVSAIGRDGQPVKPAEGDVWTLRAYETGELGEVPMEYWTELGQVPPGMPSWWGRFVPKLVGIVQ